MGWTPSLFTLVVFGSAVVALAVGFATLRERPDPMAWPLTVLMVTIAAWAIPHAISLGFTDVGAVVLWNRILTIGAVSAPVAYLVVTLRYAGYERWLSARALVALAVVPVFTIGAVWTNPVHGLYWQSYTIAQVGDASVLVPEYGVLYWVNLGYLYLVTIVALVVLTIVVVRSGPLHRKQAALIFVGGIVPLVTNVAMESNLTPDPMVDLTTTALTVSGVTFALALFHLDLMEVRPVAREWLIDELDDGVVVIGPNDRIRDFNPTAARILGDIAIDQPAEEVFSTAVVPDGGELSIETETGTRQFRARSTELTDNRGQEIGRIVYLNDITEIIEREQRISVLNRVLRHNIRNELTVISAHLNHLEEAVPVEEKEILETAKRSTERINEQAEKARHVQRTLQSRDTTMTVSATTVVEEAVEDVRERFPDADVEYERLDDVETDATVRVVDQQLFETTVTELVENAIEHNDQEVPQVTVRVSSLDEQVQVTVADNGPGIPNQEKDVLTSSTETPLNHGQGVGLWLVKWTVSLSSGSLSFTENDPRGSVVTLTLPAADE